MIRKLRIKIIAVTTGTLILVFGIIFLMLNLFMHTSSTRQTNHLLEKVAEDDGIFLFPKERLKPKQMQTGPHAPEHESFEARHIFYVKIDQDHDFFDYNYEMIFNFTEEEAKGYAEKALHKETSKGTVDDFQYLIAQKDYGKIIVFAQRNVETQMLSQLMYISLFVAVVTCLILFIFSFFFSKWAVKPIEEAFEKQRRFVSDASHELKTPLTIISTNTDVLEHEIGSDKRLYSIKTQAKRMSELVHNLLTLAKTDETESQVIPNEFDLSKTILNTTLEFESRAFEEGKTLLYEISSDISYVGDKESIKQLASILIDNAIKHSDSTGNIEVKLSKENNKVIFSVFNTGTGIEDKETEKIFDRFYRSDTSRSRETGGYGLGLSIAKSIADSHKCKISVTNKMGEWVIFTVLF